MFQQPNLKTKKFRIKKFIDFDKYRTNFFNNLYFEEFDIVVKMPLLNDINSDNNLKIEKFNLTKYCYLLSYD